MKKYDVVIIGGGHAGTEAASASARLNMNTLLITMRKENLGELSCNPSIGGLAKGHLVREIDALGGIMGQAADLSGIQFRELNASKGPAVRGYRAQIDRDLYQKNIKEILDKHTNLDIIYDTVENIILENNKVKSVLLKNDKEIQCKAIVITTGTFLKGITHTGKEKLHSGRINKDGETEDASYGISKFLKNNGFKLLRLKTGTPARLDKDTINYNVLEEQKTDNPPIPFSYLTKEITNPLISCWITRTNKKTHKIIEQAVKEGKAPLFNGQIDSIGPRYCPSIEDKVIKFPHHESHHVFIEPEGLNSNLVYPNGISTSLPQKTQEEFIHSIEGLETAKIIRPGYAIEYDAIDARELYTTLESKKIEGLYFAGQINGSSGYEEAAGQGVAAGFNAALKIQKKAPLPLDRSNSYIGVMIDDLTTLGTNEPYRMFTSRSEYRLSIRADNADLRLTDYALKLNSLSSEQKNKFIEKKDLLKTALKTSKTISLPADVYKKNNIKLGRDGRKRTLFNIFSYPDITKERAEELFPEFKNFRSDIKEQIYIEAKYHGYLKRQEKDIASFKKDKNLKFDTNINYQKIPGLSLEMQAKLNETKPESLAQAEKIPGITPAALSLLLKFTKRKKK